MNAGMGPATRAGADTELTPGVGAGLTPGVGAGLTAGVETEMKAGVGAALKAGVEAGLKAGVGAGLTAGVEAESTAGVEAGMRAGAEVGTKAGVEADTKAGIKAGVRAEMKAGVSALRWIAGVLAGLLGLLTLTTPPDLLGFAGAADLLLRGHLGEVYAGAWNQAGPAQLLINRLLYVGGTPSPVTVVLVDVALVVGAMWLARENRTREIVAGVLGLLWVAMPMPWSGHPAELAIPVLWAYAIVLQRRRQQLAAAACLALGVAIAPWAILGVPCLLAAAPPVRAVRTGLIAVALGVGAYLPFVLTGHFAMFEIKWSVSPGTVASWLGIHEVTWWLRLAQGAVVAGGVAVVAWRLRHERIAVAAVPLAAGLLRVATDPVTYPYYWFPVAVASLLLLAMVPGPRWILAGMLAYLVLVGASANWTVPLSAACLALLVAISPFRKATSATPATIRCRQHR